MDSDRELPCVEAGEKTPSHPSFLQGHGKPRDLQVRPRQEPRRARKDFVMTAPRPEYDLLYCDRTAGPHIAEILAKAPLTIEKVLTL
jgi:hypothetical protein